MTLTRILTNIIVEREINNIVVLDNNDKNRTILYSQFILALYPDNDSVPEYLYVYLDVYINNDKEFKIRVVFGKENSLPAYSNAFHVIENANNVDMVFNISSGKRTPRNVRQNKDIFDQYHEKDYVAYDVDEFYKWNVY